ncbi:hypothetical protein [Streptomyces sp. SS52]|uniref:hypothetical protein n=1 Tax=Streptomyces sp. SS52 TaxID=2563602 RepID=UPI001FF82571|nr:hypothetical protein [Streptomyces sp. SS52]
MVVVDARELVLRGADEPAQHVGVAFEGDHRRGPHVGAAGLQERGGRHLVVLVDGRGTLHVQEGVQRLAEPSARAASAARRTAVPVEGSARSVVTSTSLSSLAASTAPFSRKVLMVAASSVCSAAAAAWATFCVEIAAVAATNSALSCRRAMSRSASIQRRTSSSTPASA